MKRISLIAACMCIAASFAIDNARAAEEAAEKPIVQIAVLLDTSGSMNGLIDQAKAQLWTIVNEFATATQGGVRPDLQVALYEYGNNGERHLRMICPLTDDLDKVSQELFALSTGGGQEYCGEVIKLAIEGLKWSESKNAYKAIFIAGNEPFTQGKVDYVKSCKAAIAKGVVVNTIHCGSFQIGVNTKWQHGAELADGNYSHIDQNRKAVHIPAPQDAQIEKLGEELNTTYVGYGAEGRMRGALQAELDASSKKMAPGANVGRQMTKAGAHYNNARWDMVDGLKDGKIKIEEMKDEDLPEEMRKMTLDERKAHVAKLGKQRAEIQEKIKTLAADRAKFVAAEKKKLADKGEDTLEAVIIKSVRAQAATRNFKFEK
jgi:VWA domain-containing protein